MAGLFGGILENTIRKEMKNRIDEVLSCGREWDKSAKALTTAIDCLVAELRAAKAAGVPVNQETARQIGPPVSKLCKTTGRLAKSFEQYTRTMTKISEKL